MKTIKHLITRLQDEGLLGSRTYNGARQVIQSWMRSGKLKLRQMPHNKYYYINDQEIEEIVKAFGFEGEGKWDYRSSINS